MSDVFNLLKVKMHMYKMVLILIVLLTNLPNGIIGNCLKDELDKKDYIYDYPNKGNLSLDITDEQCLNNLQFENNIKPSNHEFTTSIEARSLKNAYKAWVDTIPLVNLVRFVKCFSQDKKYFDDRSHITEHREIRNVTRSKHKSRKHKLTNSSKNMNRLSNLHNVHIYRQSDRTVSKIKTNSNFTDELKPGHEQMQSEINVDTTPVASTLYENAWEYYLVPLPLDNTDNLKQSTVTCSQPIESTTEGLHSSQEEKKVDENIEGSVTDEVHLSSLHSTVNNKTKTDDKCKCETNSTSKDQYNRLNNVTKVHDENCRFRNKQRMLQQQAQLVSLPISPHPLPQMSKIIKPEEMLRVVNSQVSYNQQPELERSAKKTEYSSNIVNNPHVTEQQEHPRKVGDGLVFQNPSDKPHQLFHSVNEVNLHLPQSKLNSMMKVGDSFPFKNNPDKFHQQIQPVNEVNHPTQQSENSVIKVGKGLAFKNTKDVSHQQLHPVDQRNLRLPQHKENSMAKLGEVLALNNNPYQSHQEFHPDNEVNLHLLQPKLNSMMKVGNSFPLKNNPDKFHQQIQPVNEVNHLTQPPENSVIKVGKGLAFKNTPDVSHQQFHLVDQQNIRLPQHQENSMAKISEVLALKNKSYQSHQQSHPVDEINLYIPQQHERSFTKIGGGLAFKSNILPHQQIHSVNEASIHPPQKQEHSLTNIGDDLAFKSNLDRFHQQFDPDNVVNLRLPQQQEHYFTKISDGITCSGNLDRSHQQFHPNSAVNIHLPQQQVNSFSKIGNGLAFARNIDQPHQRTTPGNKVNFHLPQQPENSLTQCCNGLGVKTYLDHTEPQFHPENKVKITSGSSVLDNNLVQFRLPPTQVSSSIKTDGMYRSGNSDWNSHTQSQLESSVTKTEDHSILGHNFSSLSFPLQHKNGVMAINKQLINGTNTANLVQQHPIFKDANTTEANSALQNHSYPQPQISSERSKEDIAGIGNSPIKYVPRQQWGKYANTFNKNSNLEKNYIHDPHQEIVGFRNNSESSEWKNGVSNTHLQQPLVNDTRQINDISGFQIGRQIKFSPPKLPCGTKSDIIPSFKNNEDKLFPNEASVSENDFYYKNNLACPQNPLRSGSPFLKTDKLNPVNYKPNTYIPQQASLTNTSNIRQGSCNGYYVKPCLQQQTERAQQTESAVSDRYSVRHNISVYHQPVKFIDATKATSVNSKSENNLRPINSSPQRENINPKVLEISNSPNSQLNHQQENYTTETQINLVATNQIIENTIENAINSIIEVNHKLLNQHQFKTNVDTNHLSTYGFVHQNNELKNIKSVTIRSNGNSEWPASTANYAKLVQGNYYSELLKQTSMSKYKEETTEKADTLLLSRIEPFTQTNVSAKTPDKGTVHDNYREPKVNFVVQTNGDDIGIGNNENHMLKEQVTQIGSLVPTTPEVSSFENNKYVFMKQPMEYKTNMNKDSVTFGKNSNSYHQAINQESNTSPVEEHVKPLNNPFVNLQPTQLVASRRSTPDWCNKLKSNQDFMFQKKQPLRNYSGQFDVSPTDWNYLTPSQREYVQQNTSDTRSVDSCTFESEYKFTQILNNSDSYFAPKDEIFRFENYSPPNLSQTKVHNLQTRTESSNKCGNNNMFIQNRTFLNDFNSKVDESITKCEHLDLKQQQVEVKNSSPRTYDSLKSGVISDIPKYINQLPHNVFKTGILDVSLGKGNDYLFMNRDRHENHLPNTRENLNSYPQCKSLGNVCSYSDIHGVGSNSAIDPQIHNIRYDKGVENGLRFRNNELFQPPFQISVNSESGGKKCNDNLRVPHNPIPQPYYQQNNVMDFQKTFGIGNNVANLSQTPELKNSTRKMNDMPMFRTYQTYEYPSQVQLERTDVTSKLTQQERPPLSNSTETNEMNIGLTTIEGLLLRKYNLNTTLQPIQEINKVREPCISAVPGNQAFLPQTNKLQSNDRQKEDYYNRGTSPHSINQSQSIGDTNRMKTDNPWNKNNVQYTQNQNNTMNSNRNRVRNSGSRKKRLFFHQMKQSHRNITEHP